MKQGWEYKKLNEVCDKGSSNIVINKLIDNNGDYPLYGASGLIKNIDFYHQDKRYIGIVKDGAGVGRVNIYPAFSSLVGTMQYIFPKEGYSLDFIKYFLIKLDLSYCVSGATIPHIYFKDYGKELIPTPSLDTQQTIVSELDKINELIRLKKEQLKDFDNLAQSIFYEMFGDPVENEMGWEVKKLGEVSSSKGGGTPSKSKPEYWNGNIAWVSSKDMKSMYISDTQLHITDLGMQNSPAKLLPIGTILIVNRSGILKHTLPIAITTKAVTINQDIKALLVNDKIANALFVLYTLKMSSSYLLSKTKAVTVDSINFAEFKALKIPLPPLPLQHLFAHRIEQIEHQKAEVQKAIIDLETLLASRMQYWFE